MKKLLVFVFMSISIGGISQSNEEMKCIEKNKIEYNGEVIKLKRAIELSEGVSEVALRDFKLWHRRSVPERHNSKCLFEFCFISLLSGLFIRT